MLQWKKKKGEAGSRCGRARVWVTSFGRWAFAVDGETGDTTYSTQRGARDHAQRLVDRHPAAPAVPEAPHPEIDIVRDTFTGMLKWAQKTMGVTIRMDGRIVSAAGLEYSHKSAIDDQADKVARTAALLQDLKDAHLLGVFGKETVLGFGPAVVVLWDDGSHPYFGLYIKSIVVSPECRRKGHATSAIAALCKGADIHRVALYTPGIVPDCCGLSPAAYRHWLGRMAFQEVSDEDDTLVYDPAAPPPPA